ncbi:hypothetical protein ACXX81_07520 [Pseudomonas sp. GNP013]
MSTIPVPYDELTPPAYSVYPPRDLSKTLYPEKSAQGLGRRGMVPFACFGIERWRDLAVGDYLGLRIGDLTQPIASSNVVTDEIRYFLYIDANKIGEGDLQYFSRVLRVASLQESRSTTEMMLFKQTIPAGHDRRPEEPWHSGLFMWFRDLKENDIISPDVIAGGLVVMIQPYLNIRKNDQISIFVDGIPYVHVVSPTEASRNLPIEITIPEETLLKISASGPIGVVFTVEDVVGNIPEGKYFFSKSIPLISEMEAGLLPFPLFLADGDVIDQLDLDIHSAAKLQVDVPLTFYRPTPAPLNKVTVVVQTTDKNGVTSTVRLPTVDDKNRRRELVQLPTSMVTNLAGGRIRVWFELTRAGRPVETSSSTLLNVVGTPTLMPPITLIPYEAGLVPSNTDVTAQLPVYSPHDPKNLETLVCEQIREDGGGQRLTFRQLAGPQGGTRILPKTSLKVFEDKGVFHAYYETDDGGGKPSSIRQSQLLGVEIGTRVEDLNEMVVPDAVDANIDPTTVAGDEWLMFVPYPGTVAGDKVSWSVIGKDSQRSATGIIDVTNAIAGVILTTLSIPVSTEVLAKNKDGSLRISYSVQSAGTPSKILRSRALDVTIGLPVELDVLKILEADPLSGTLAPRNVINGATLRISYKSMRKGDQIFYRWDGYYDVSQYEGVTIGNPSTNSIDVLIPADVIAKGIRQDGNDIAINCEVRRGQFVYSFDTLYVKLLPLAVLPTPSIPGFEGATVLPVYLLSNNALIHIPIWAFMLLGQPVWLTVTGTFDDDTPYVEQLYIAKNVTAEELIKGVFCPLPVDKLLQLMDGSVFSIEFWVSLPGIPSKPAAIKFGVANYRIQLLPSSLSYPMLNGAESSAQETTVDPLAIEKNITVTVKYSGMLATDVITLLWIFQNGTQSAITLNGQASGVVVFDFTALQVVQKSVNSRVQLKYSIIRRDKVIPSYVQTVKVETIQQAKLPMPVINRTATGGTLDLNTFIDNAVAAIGKWPLSTAGQLVWLTCSSVGVADLRVLNAAEITAAQAAGGLIDIGVLRSWLKSVPKGQVIHVVCHVSFTGIYEQRLAFPLNHYILNDSWVDLLTDFRRGMGSWSKGRGGYSGTLDGRGIYFNTPALSNSGSVIEQVFNFNKAHRYDFGCQVSNVSPQPSNVPPILEVLVGGRVVVSRFTVPRNGVAYNLAANFTVSQSGPAALVIYNHMDLGGGADSRGGNDFYIHFVTVFRLS